MRPVRSANCRTLGQLYRGLSKRDARAFPDRHVPSTVLHLQYHSVLHANASPLSQLQTEVGSLIACSRHDTIVAIGKVE